MAIPASARHSGSRTTSARSAPFAFEAWPTEFRVITQHFGARPIYYARFGLPGHEGVDFQAPDGSRVFCVAPGAVVKVHEDDDVHNYGCNVRVEHAGGYTSIYAHLQEAHVHEGDAVSAGQILGLAGHSGNADGAHLHLTLKKKRARLGQYPNNIIDPTPFVEALMAADEGVEIDDAAYIRDTIPDGTVMPPRHAFEQTWFMRNSGTTTWEDYEFACIGGPTLGAAQVAPLPVTPPGAETPVTLRFQAPAEPGRHRSVWRARDADDELFGDPVWVDIEVLGPSPGLPAQAPDGFVRRKGRQLLLDDQPFRFIGANLRGLVHYGKRTSDPLKYSRLEHRNSQLNEAQRMGARVARLFLADKDASFDEIEQRLRETLDIVKHQLPDLYLLPAFTNLYNDVPFFVPGDEGCFYRPPGDSRDLLNRDFFAGGYEKNYLPFVEQIVMAFRTEPNILAWEIGNELKLDRNDKSDPNDPNPPLFIQFNLDVAAHIKRWDPHHLVTTGMKSTHHAWLHTSALQEALYRSPNIDFITIHSYEGMWDQEGDRRVYDDAALAVRLDKPFIVEETGFDVRVFADRPSKYAEHMAKWFDLGASGYMPWGFNHQREIGDGDHDVGIDESHADSPRLFALFQRTAGDIAAGARSIAPALADGCAYIAGRDVVQDGAILPPRHRFTQTWRIRNTGDSAWSAGYRIVWTGGDSLEAPNQIAAPACSPGQETPISVSFVTPAAPGRYRSQWQLCNDRDELFGDQFWVEIEVVPSVRNGAFRDITGRGIGVPSEPALPGVASEITLAQSSSPALEIIHSAYWRQLAVIQAVHDPALKQHMIQSAAQNALEAIAALTDQGDQVGN